MVATTATHIIITIPSSDPAVDLLSIQTGIIDLMSNLLSQGREGKDLEIDQDTAHGSYQLLKLLRETLTVDTQGQR